MRPETLKAAIDFFCQNQDNIEFIWHGGEPLLAELNFYHQAVEYQDAWKQKGKKIANFIQTNSTLITPEWTRFFAKYNFFVSTSLDGPQEFHDQVRRYSAGKKGSYDDVMKGIDLSRHSKVFNGIICDISKVNYKFPEKLFNFFIDKKIKKLKFARVKDIGHCKNVSALAITPAQYTDFMIAIFDIWLALDDPEVEIRDIQSVVNLIFGGNKRECIYMGKCDQFVTVYHDGSIYSCDSFPKIDALYFGNVSDRPNTIKSSRRLKSFQRLIQKRKTHCETCKWFSICQGGCSKSYYARLNSLKPLNEVCKNLIRYFEHVLAKTKYYNLV
jgi:uncharacterized protein